MKNGSAKPLTNAITLAIAYADLFLQLYSGGVSSNGGAVWVLALFTVALIVTARPIG
jgi:hypothetical protein